MLLDPPVDLLMLVNDFRKQHGQEVDAKCSHRVSIECFIAVKLRQQELEMLPDTHSTIAAQVPMGRLKDLLIKGFGAAHSFTPAFPFSTAFTFALALAPWTDKLEFVSRALTPMYKILLKVAPCAKVIVRM